MAKAPSTTKQVQIISWKEFADAILDLGKEAFVDYMAYLRATISIHPAWQAQIALLVAKNVNIPIEYLDIADKF